MSRTITRAEDLAAQLEAINDGVMAEVSASGEEAWRRVTENEGWPVGVVAHHIASVQRFFAGVLAGLASGARAPALSNADVDENNARHAREFAGVGRPETMVALRVNSAELLEVIRGLSDDDLARTALIVDGQELTGAQVIELGLIGHLREHLASMQATIGQ